MQPRPLRRQIIRYEHGASTPCWLSQKTIEGEENEREERPRKRGGCGIPVQCGLDVEFASVFWLL